MNNDEKCKGMFSGVKLSNAPSVVRIYCIILDS
jgi:hypothetical protein